MAIFTKPIFIAGLVVVFGAGAYIFLTPSATDAPILASAAIKDVVQEVSLTGKVKPAQGVDLAFERGGRIARIFKNIGDEVAGGGAILQLDQGTLLAELAEARANVLREEAKLAELEVGTRSEDIAVKQAELESAERNLENYYNDVSDTLHDAFFKVDDAARIKTAGIFSGSQSTVYAFTYDSCDVEAEQTASFLRLKIETVLNDWKKEVDTLTDATTQEKLIEFLRHAKENAGIARDLLQSVATTLSTGCTIGNSSLDTYRTNVSTARTNVSAVTQDITSLEQLIQSQKLTVQKVQKELDLKLAGSTPEQVRAQVAQVAQVNARVANINSQLRDTVIRSPIEGVMTKQDAKVGEIVSAGALLVSVISEAEFEIEANVPEADIAKLTAGSGAHVTLDAYGSDVIFMAVISQIDPAETVIEGVPTYTTTFQFAEPDTRIRSGMTANISIETARRENVIAIPQRAVITKNGGKVVRVLTGNVIREVSVETGLRGSLGDIEIISGIREGDEVVLFLNE